MYVIILIKEILIIATLFNFEIKLIILNLTIIYFKLTIN
jgi:hypothetical protein